MSESLPSGSGVELGGPGNGTQATRHLYLKLRRWKFSITRWPRFQSLPYQEDWDPLP